MSKYYAGIGSRETPLNVEPVIEKVCILLEEKGYTMRSGGAPGADSMFGEYAKTQEIYLPWPLFNASNSDLYLENLDAELVKEARMIAEYYHPGWDRLSEAAKKLMTRNTFQVLGMDLKTPSEFIVCWTKGGKVMGGTGQAMRIAIDRGIPIFNLYNEDCLQSIKRHVNRQTLF